MLGLEQQIGNRTPTILSLQIGVGGSWPTETVAVKTASVIGRPSLCPANCLLPTYLWNSTGAPFIIESVETSIRVRSVHFIRMWSPELTQIGPCQAQLHTVMVCESVGR